jgi:hypothetical protein
MPLRCSIERRHAAAAESLASRRRQLIADTDFDAAMPARQRDAITYGCHAIERRRFSPPCDAKFVSAIFTQEAVQPKRASAMRASGATKRRYR